MLESHQPNEDLHVVIRGEKAISFQFNSFELVPGATRELWSSGACIIRVGTRVHQLLWEAQHTQGCCTEYRSRCKQRKKQCWSWRVQSWEQWESFVFVCVCMGWTCTCKGCCENKLHLTSFLSLPLKHENRPGPRKLFTFHWTALGGNTRNRWMESWFGTAWARHQSLLSL